MLAMGDSALRKGADAMTFVGCDLHTRMQQVAVLDTGTGESSVLTRLHHEPEEGLEEVTRRHSTMQPRRAEGFGALYGSGGTATS
jgi:hypothetical protein